MPNRVYANASFIFGSFLVLASSISFAAGPKDITEAEWALLPKYCPHTQGYKGYVQPHVAKWEAMMGPTFIHVHHYCWGLLKFRRAERAMTPAQEKKYLFTEALDDFSYVVKNSEKDFVLLPEILTWIGRTEIRLRRPADANQAFGQARMLKPDYWPAYTFWTEYLISIGKKTEALSLVKTGLQHSPESKVLLSQYRSMGGKPDEIPAPIRKEETAPPEPVANSPQETEQPSAPVTAPPAPN